MSVQTETIFVNLREHECNEGAADHDGIQDVPEVPTVTARMEDNSKVYDLMTERSI